MSIRTNLSPSGTTRNRQMLPPASRVRNSESSLEESANALQPELLPATPRNSRNNRPEKVRSLLKDSSIEEGPRLGLTRLQLPSTRATRHILHSSARAPASFSCQPPR